MSDDEKMKFFLRHRALIMEWASLRDRAATELDQALEMAVDDMPLPDSVTPKFNKFGQQTYVHLGVPGADGVPAWVELTWWPKTLFNEVGGNAWPILLVGASTKPELPTLRDAVKEATRPIRAAHGLDLEGRGSSPWVWYGTLDADEPIDIDEYARSCAERFHAAWTDLHPRMLDAIRTLDRDGASGSSSQPEAGHGRQTSRDRPARQPIDSD